MMRDYIDKLWTEIVKGSDGKTSNCEMISSGSSTFFTKIIKVKLLKTQNVFDDSPFNPVTTPSH